jgi:hypothetical protein
VAWRGRRVQTRNLTARVLTASGKRIDPASTVDLKDLKDGRDPSEQDCWRWNRVIGEVKFGSRFMRNACARVTLPIAVIPDQDADPIPLTSAIEQGLVAGYTPDEAMYDTPVISKQTADLAVAAMAEMMDGQDREGSLLGGWGAKSFVVGDGYLIGYTEPRLTPPRAEEPVNAEGEGDARTRQRWVFVAPHVLVENSSPKDGQSRFALKEKAGNNGSVMPLPADAFILRIWREHEEWPEMADSLVRGVLLECEELYVTQRAIKSVALSKLSAPILVIANEFSAGGDNPQNDDSENPTDDPLNAAYVEHVTTPIGALGTAAEVAGLVLRVPLDPDGTGKYKPADGIFTVDATRKIDETVIARCTYLISRIRAGLEFPTELYDGMGSSSHWSAWEISDNVYTEFVQPTVREFADQVLTKYLRPRLEASGVDADEAARITLLDDASRLIARPNRGSNARDAHASGAISDASYREAVGFDDGDAPSDEEIERRMILAGGVTPEMVAAWFNQMVNNPPLPMPAAMPALPVASEEEEPEGGADQIPDEAITSAARRRTAGERLAAIDARLLDRITRLADQTVTRMIAQAGQRVLSTLAGDQRGDPQRIAARDLIRHVKDKARIPATLGANRLAELNIDAERLLEDQLDEAHAVWEEEVREAQRAAARVTLAQLLAAGPDDPEAVAFEAKQDEHRIAAWPVFAAAVLAASRQALFAPPPQPGEPGSPGVPRVQPGVVREALAKAGGSQPITSPTGALVDAVTGAPVGLVATGDDVAELWGMHGKPWTGYVWQHTYDGPSPFVETDSGPEAHAALDGVAFESWDDPVLSTAGTGYEWVGDSFLVGDHAGCACVVAPTYDD